MFKFTRFCATASMVAVATVLTTPAFAAQTVAGSEIKNTVTVAYKVGGVSQTDLTAEDKFLVDRKVNLTVVQEGTATTQVSPGQANAVTTFLVSNLSNAAIDISLAASNLSGDDYDVSNFKLYADTDNSGGFNAGDVEITYLDQVAAETSNIRVFVVAKIPLGQTSGQIANVRLTGTAAEANPLGTFGALGATIVKTAGANTAGVDTVLADSANADGNIAGNGIHFADDSYTVLAAALTALKTSRIVQDPVNGTTNPMMIPGATVEYCIALTNAGLATATDVAISDTLPTETTYLSSFGVKVNGTVTSSVCNSDGAIAGAESGGVVTGTIPSVATNQTRTVLFRVTIK